ncbi:hypothetical protein [Pseudomonas marginalis]|uniref:hypothetical protein n=1 Tax=Pseudomonas marginalis TaxID=298 RepID=UPI0005FBFBCC|nr:hypothetical protein [Pseudomonas marginalis]KJZ43239.1 hypothetical protein VC37_29880 [Pseudomonas marginalis]KJZ51458.1 hypothetical protein VC36_29535 [Pseudomonas marginalis]
MKLFVAFALVATLAGCATQGKSEKQILDEAATAYVASMPAGSDKLRLHTMNIPKSGVFGDTLAISVAGEQNAARLRGELLDAKRLGDVFFLIIGAGTPVDVAVIGKAVEGQDLKGMQIYYSGTEAQKDTVRAAVEKTQAQFHYINAQ